MKSSLNIGACLKGNSYTYKIERVLGQGSFGITYLATTNVKVAGALGELETTMKVAVKEFFMKDINEREGTSVTCGSKGGIYDNYKRKFAREAKNLSHLQHPHIIKVLESFEANNTVYYTMEYCAGGSLDILIKNRGKLTEEETLPYFRQIASALTFMHEHKMLHLDLKPANVMLRSNGDVALIDFGLSKQYDEHGIPESSTTIGGGTPGYAPIEQSNYREGKDFPVTMDVYALGATLYKMLTGKRPEEASVLLNDGFPDDSLRELGISDKAISCIEKAMAPTKKMRYQTVNELFEVYSGINTNNSGSERNLKINQTEENTEFSSSVVVKQEKIPAQKPVYGTTYKRNRTDSSSKREKWIIGIVVFLLLVGGMALIPIIVGLPVSKTEQVAETMETSSDVAEQETLKSVQAANNPPKASVKPKQGNTSDTKPVTNNSKELKDVATKVVSATKNQSSITPNSGKKPGTDIPADEKPIEASIQAQSEEPPSEKMTSTERRVNGMVELPDYVEVVEEEVEEESIPFQLVQIKPSFQGGGANSFSKWVNERLVYPEVAKENGLQGRITLQFTIDKDGSLTNVKVLRSKAPNPPKREDESIEDYNKRKDIHIDADPSLEKEAVRVVSMSPKWTPGIQRERPVPVTYTFPVIFQLR